MSYYKVYGQNIRGVKPIQEIFECDLDDYFGEIVNNAIEFGYVPLDDVDDDNFNQDHYDQVLNEAYAKVKKFFDEMGFLGCGDYMIIKAEDGEELQRPGAVGYDTDRIFG
jgi:hypothetical protein